MNEKKKLLYYIPHFPVLSETFIEREASKLVEFDQMDITILSLTAGSGAMSENIKDKVHYVRLTIGICVSALFSYVFKNPKKMIEIHKLVMGKDRLPYFLNLSKDDSARTKMSVLGRFHGSRFIHYWKGVAYAKVFEKYHPDHIHAHFLSDSSTVAMVAAKILGVPFSISAHATDVFREGTLIPIKAREAKFITVCNGNTWKEAVKYANQTKSSGKVKLIFHGIDSNKFLDVAIPEKPKVPFIFTIARLVEKKGLRYLIEASKILKTRNIDHVVKIAGYGPMYHELLDLIEKNDLASNVQILGEGKGIPNVQVAGLLQVADIYAAPFIHASDNDVDGVPTTVIEAALAKVPIIATDSGSIADLVTEETGLIVKQRDSVGLADAIEKLINDKELSQKLVLTAHKQAREQFDLNKNVGELQNLINN